MLKWINKYGWKCVFIKKKKKNFCFGFIWTYYFSLIKLFWIFNAILIIQDTRDRTLKIIYFFIFHNDQFFKRMVWTFHRESLFESYNVLSMCLYQIIHSFVIYFSKYISEERRFIKPLNNDGVALVLRRFSVLNVHDQPKPFNERTDYCYYCYDY